MGWGWLWVLLVAVVVITPLLTVFRSWTKSTWAACWGWVKAHAYEDVLKDSSGRHAPQMPKLAYLVPLTLVGAALGGWFLLAALARLGGYDVEWWPPQKGDLHDPDDTNASLFDLARSTATLAALFGGVFAIVYAYRKQRVEEAAGRRADEENLREQDEARSKRFQDAAGQLGHGKAAVRLAGIYAMARLADEWPAERQVCVDVLCAYLRMPFERDDGEEWEVRKSLCRLFASRVGLALTAPKSWCALDLDFTGAIMADFSFVDCSFKRKPVFDRTQFEGECRFENVHFEQGASFESARIKGHLTLSSPSGNADLSLESMAAEGGGVALLGDLQFPHGSGVSLNSLQISGDGYLTVRARSYPAHDCVFLHDLTVHGGRVHIATVPKAKLPDTTLIDASDWVVSKGRVNIPQRLVTSGRMAWSLKEVGPAAVVMLGKQRVTEPYGQDGVSQVEP